MYTKFDVHEPKVTKATMMSKFTKNGDRVELRAIYKNHHRTTVSNSCSTIVSSFRMVKAENLGTDGAYVNLWDKLL